MNDQLNFAIPGAEGVRSAPAKVNNIPQWDRSLVSYLLANDDEEFVLDTGTAMKPVVKTEEYLGTPINGTYNPATDCCVKLDASLFNQNEFVGGEFCVEERFNKTARLINRKSTDLTGGDFFAGDSAMKTRERIMERTVYTLLQSGLVRGSSAVASTSSVPSLDGLVSIYNLPTVGTANAAGSIIRGLDQALSVLEARSSLSNDIVAFLHPQALAALQQEATKDCCVAGLVLKAGFNGAGNELTYKGIRFVTSMLIPLDTVTGLTKIYIDSGRNLAAKALFMQQDGSYSNTAQAIVDQATWTAPNCGDVTVRMAGFAVAYAKNTFGLVRIDNVNAAPNGVSVWSGMTNALNPVYEGIILN